VNSTGSRNSALESARRTIRRRKRLILVTFALILLGDIVGTYAMTPLWLGQARILVMPGPFHGLSPLDPVGRQGIEGKEAGLSTLDVVEMLGSRDLALGVVKRFHLDEKKGPGGLRGALQAIWEGLLSVPGRVICAITRTEYVELTPLDEAVKTLQDDMADISEERDTSIVNVGVWGDSPELANSLANSLAESLIEEDTAASRREAEQSYQFTKQELGRADARLDGVRAKLRTFREREHFADPERDLAAMMARLEQAQKALDVTQAELAGARAQLEQTRGQLSAQKETIVAAQVVATNPVVEQLRADLVRMELELASELQYKQEAHPDVQRLRARMEQNKERLRSEIERTVDTETVGMNPVHQQLLVQSLTLDAHAQGLEAQSEAQTAAMGAAQSDLDALAAKSVEFEQLNADVEAAAEVAGELRLALEELDTLRHTDVGLAGTRIRIVERSAVPNEQRKDRPSWAVSLGAGLLAGVVLSLTLAFFLEYWRQEPGEEGTEA
jgi:uncharacterized protein involved in exopolysaccharide biosynthesis